MAANGGSLEDWISARSGDAASASPRPSGSLAHPSEGRQRAERLKAALRLRRSSMDASIRAQNRDAPPIGVHLLREEEIYSLLQDITSGLGFLHDRGVLHLDIKVSFEPA